MTGTRPGVDGGGASDGRAGVDAVGIELWRARTLAVHAGSAGLVASRANLGGRHGGRKFAVEPRGARWLTGALSGRVWAGKTSAGDRSGAVEAGLRKLER